MSDFKVGDKIRYSKWSPDFWFVVQWVGDELYAGVRESGRRCSMSKCSDLELWSPPFPFKAGDKITKKSGKVEVVVGVEDPLPGKPQFTARYCDTGRLYPFLKDIPGDSWVRWIPPFPFKSGDVLRRSRDHVSYGNWLVYDPQPNSDKFLGWWDKDDGEPCEFDKECWNGEWVLVPTTKRYTVVTESRVPKKGDVYFCAGTFIVATEDHQATARDVIVSINSESE